MRLGSAAAVAVSLAMMVTVVAGCPRSSSQSLVPLQASSKQAVRCAMCGKEVGDKTRVVVTLASGDQKVFCCPHCALMEMSMPQTGIPANVKVMVTDWETGALIPSDTARFVYGSNLVPCCSPSVIPFKDQAAAESFVKEHGGALVDWKECATRMEGVRCAACGMPTTAATATHVLVGSEDKLACCPTCAVKLLAKYKGDHVQLTAKCDECGGKIEVDSAQDQTKVQPTAAVLWVGMRNTSQGTKLRGCHFNHWFDSTTCLQAWQAKHPDETGQALTIAQALQTSGKSEEGGAR